jgi:hypothetical protein
LNFFCFSSVISTTFANLGGGKRNFNIRKLGEKPQIFYLFLNNNPDWEPAKLILSNNQVSSVLSSKTTTALQKQN